MLIVETLMMRILAAASIYNLMREIHEQETLSYVALLFGTVKEQGCLFS